MSPSGTSSRPKHEDRGGAMVFASLCRRGAVEAAVKEASSPGRSRSTRFCSAS
jgi:hypothetical protein